MRNLMVRPRTLPRLMARLIGMASFAAFLYGPSPGWAATAPDLGTASNFAVLSGGALDCTTSTVGGDVVAGGAFTNTGCTITGAMPPATNTVAVQAHTDFISAYTALAPQTGDCDVAHTLLSTITGPVTLLPGVYCTGAALTGTGALTLDGQGDVNAVWIFKIGAALTGTNFSVVMANGGQPCNVTWWVGAGTSMTTSAFKGNILAGGATGAITLTGGTLAGRALANVAVTMTDASVFGCGALSGPPSSPCEDKDRDGDDHDDDKKHRDNEHKDKDNKHGDNDKKHRSGHRS